MGAGCPPPGTYGRYWDTDRSWFNNSDKGSSNYGARIDIQDWAQEITTPGIRYPDLIAIDDPDYWSTLSFGNTSGSRAMIGGLLASLNSILKVRGLRPITSPEAIRFLRSRERLSKRAQNSRRSHRIRNQPNMQALIPATIALVSA